MLVEIMKFSPYIDQSISMNQLMYRYIVDCFDENSKVKNIPLALILEPEKMWGKNYDGKSAYLIGLERDCLGIPATVPFSKFNVEIGSPYKEEARDAFNKLGLRKGRTVFLLINGNYFGKSIFERHFDFWKTLAKKLKALDYDVVVNAEKVILDDCPSVYLGVHRTSEFIGLCGNVVSVPSGMLESACAFNCKDKIKVQVLFPNDIDPFWREKIYVWNRDCLPILKYWGGDFVQHRMNFHSDYMRLFWNENIKFVCRQWEDIEGEDLNTVNKVLDFIKSDEL